MERVFVKRSILPLNVLLSFLLFLNLIPVNNGEPEVPKSVKTISWSGKQFDCEFQAHSTPMQLTLTEQVTELPYCSPMDLNQSYVCSENPFNPPDKWTPPGSLLILWIPLSLLSIVILLSYWHQNWSKMGKMMKQFPGPRYFPIIGSSYIFAILNMQDLVRIMSRLAQKYNRTFRIWAFHKPYIIITEAESAQKILSSSRHIEKGRVYKMFKWMLGDGLITSNGQIWKNDRKILSPSFKYQKFDGFLSSFNRHSSILVNILKQKFNLEGNQSQNLHSTFCRCTTDFITESALGTKTSFQTDPDTDFVKATNIALYSFRTRILKPWSTLPLIWNIFLEKKERMSKEIINRILLPIIEERRKLVLSKTTNGENETKPFIDVLLETHRSSQDIIGHVATISGAGFETTASAMNYTLFLLACNPKHQGKVHEELDRVLEGDKTRDLTFADLSEIKYLEMCVKEALRLYPPVPLFIRWIQEDIPLDNGLTIPKGSDVIFLIYEMHRDPRYFPQPEKFDPERFLPDLCAMRHPYAYLPFSLGPRNCLGLRYAMIQLKTVLTHILRSFTITTDMKRENLKLLYGMVLEPVGGIGLKLTQRN